MAGLACICTSGTAHAGDVYVSYANGGAATYASQPLDSTYTLLLRDEAVSTHVATPAVLPKESADMRKRREALEPLIRETSARYGLEPALVRAIAHVESRFNTNAVSPAGAAGIMQLMPGTAQLVAKKIGLGPISREQMNDINTNILLGTNYLSMIYNQFDGSAVLATAGYNAGPGRPRNWRQTLQHPVEGAIFAEAIPFQETRDYVKNVLSNTVYYAALFEGRPQSLKARLGYIAP